MSRDQPSKSDPWGLRRSPRIQMLQLNTQKRGVNVGGNAVKCPVEDTKNDGRKQDSDSFVSFGVGTQEAMDAMDLDDSLFQKVSVSQLRMEELGNQRKTNHEDAAIRQTNCQMPRRLQCQKSRNSKDECAKESLCLVRRKEDISRYSSRNGNASKQDNCLCENKRSSDKEERNAERRSKRLKDHLICCLESSVNPTYKQHQETCSNKNNFIETNVLKQCPKGLGKNNKENILDFDDSHEGAIDPAGGTEKAEPLLKQQQKCQSPSSSHKQPKTDLHATPKEHIILPILKSSALCAQSNSLPSNSKACQSLAMEQKLQKETNNAILVDEVLNEKRDGVNGNSSIPDNGTKTNFSLNNMENTVLKSPLNSDDSRSFLSTQEKMELSAWGLPETVLKVL